MMRHMINLFFCERDMILLSKEGNTNKSTTTITQSFWAEDCELLDLGAAALGLAR